MLGQIWAVALLNLRNIHSRWSSSLVIVVGAGGVVGVLLTIMGMANGLDSVLKKAGNPDVAVVMRSGSIGEMSSFVEGTARRIVETYDGVVAAATELYVVSNIPKADTGTDANVVVRGVEEASLAIRPDLNIVDGRMFTTGLKEVIVGKLAHQEFAGLNIGDKIALRESEWTVVGIFECGGSAYESEIWADLLVTQSAFRRGTGGTSIRVLLDSPSRIEQIALELDDDPRFDLAIMSEEEFFAGQSTSTTALIETFALVVGVIMAFGAVFAGLNSMYTAVAARTREIATLRAIGFRGGPVVVSVIVESTVLAFLGGCLGGLVAYVAFNGFTASTLSQATFSQISFNFDITIALVGVGIVVALGIGIIGGIFPAVRAALLPVTVALRAE